MKKFTFLLLIIAVAVIAHGQSVNYPESKIRQLIDNYNNSPVKKLSPRYFQLKSLQFSHALKSAAQTITLDSVIYQTYATESSSWVNLYKDEYIFDAQLQNTQWNEKAWNGTLNTWEDETRVVLEHDSQGRVTEMIIYSADDQGGELVSESRMVAYYSNEGVLDSVEHYSMDEEENWVVQGLQVYHYNEAGQLTRMDMTSTEEDEEEEYLQVLRFDYTYNSQGNLEKSTIHIIDEDFELLFSQTEFFYDEQGRRNASEYSMMDFFTFEFSPFSRTEYTYNASDDVSEETSFLWDDTEEDWVVDQRDEYVYRDLNFNEVVFPSYIMFFGINEETNEFNKVLSEITSYSMAENNWVESERTKFYYSDETSTSAPVRELVKVDVFPNPATDNITINWNGFQQLSLEIFQMSGTKTLEMVVHPGREVSVSHLPRGMYIYKLLNNRQTVHSGKLVKN